MINVLVPVVDRPNEYLKSVMALNGNPDVRLLIGVTAKISNENDFNLKNAVVRIYEESAEKEQMINDFQELLDGDAVFIARKPFTRDDFNAFTSANATIVTCETAKKGKLYELVRGIWQKLVKLIFGVKFFKGDPSLIYFSNGLSGVLTQVGNLSYSTRVDRWKGAPQEVAKSTYPNVKFGENNNYNLILLVCSLLTLAVGALVTTLVCVFAKMTVLAGILLFFLDAFCVCIFALLLMAYLFNDKVGRKEIKKIR